MDPPKSLVKFSKFVEYFMIVGSGLYLHLNRLSIWDMRITNIPGLVPSLASTIFIFSVLNIFAIGKPTWPAKNSRKLIKFIIELALILYSVEMILRHFWVPALKVVSLLCKHGSRSLRDKIPMLSMWLAESGYGTMKLVMALATLGFMLEIVGFPAKLKGILEHFLKNCSQPKTEVPVVPLVPKATQPIITYPIRTRSRSRKRVSFEETPQIENDIPLLTRLLTSPRARSIIDILRLRNHHNQCSICHEPLG